MTDVFDGFHNFLTNSKNQFTAVTAVFTAAVAENIDEATVTNIQYNLICIAVKCISV